MSEKTSYLEGRPLWWRRTASTPRIGPLDARTCFPVILVLIHPRAWTLLLAGTLIVVFGVLQMFRMSPPEALRALGVIARTLGFRQPVLRVKKRTGGMQ